MNKLSLFYFLLVFLFSLPFGVSVATFFYADGAAYLSANPKACTNCHVMQGQYDSWQVSSHRTVATCNDCHSNGNFIQKYSQKGLNGFLHSYAFTTGFFHEPIQIKNFNLKITQKACVSCHSPLIESSQVHKSDFQLKNCLTCHREVGHRKW